MDVMSSVKDLKYTHLILSLANTHAVRSISNEECDLRTKLWAYTYLFLENDFADSYKQQLTRDKDSIIHSLEEKEYYVLLYMLLSDIRELNLSIRDLKSEFRKFLNTYKNEKNIEILNLMFILLKRIVILDIILKESINVNVITEDFFDDMNEFLHISSGVNKSYESCSLPFLLYLSLINNHKDNSKIRYDERFFRILDLSDIESLLISLYSSLYSYKATKDTQYLMLHYLVFKRIINNIETIARLTAPHSSTLQIVFKLASLLRVCGYHHSLSLPDLERVNYLINVFGKSHWIDHIYSSFDKEWNYIKIKKQEVKCPTEYLLGFPIIFLVLRILIGDFNVPLSFSKFGITVGPLEVPALISASLVSLVFTFWRLYQFKQNFKKILYDDK